MCQCCRRHIVGLKRGAFCMDIEPVSPVIRQFGTKIPRVQSLALSVTEVSYDAEEVVFQWLAFCIPLGVCLLHGHIAGFVLLDNLEDRGMTNSLSVFSWLKGMWELERAMKIMGVDGRCM